MYCMGLNKQLIKFTYPAVFSLTHQIFSCKVTTNKYSSKVQRLFMKKYSYKTIFLILVLIFFLVPVSAQTGDSELQTPTSKVFNLLWGVKGGYSQVIGHYDDELKHMVVDEDQCLGSDCGECLEACPADIPRFYPPDNDFSMVCDLCEKDGKRRPQCVEICPTQALEFVRPKIPHHLERIHPDEKAASIAKRLYPLSKDRVIRLPEEIWGGK